MLRGVLAGVAAIAIVATVGCGVLGSKYRYHYRITVVVDTLQGLKTGSAVHEQIVGSSNVDLGELSAKRGIRTRGEAVAVDLPNSQTLFVLLPGSEAAQSALDPQWQNDWVQSARRIIRGETPRGPMPIEPETNPSAGATASAGPALVRFRNLDDPASIEWVDPKNLEASFGKGVRLRSITVQVTEDPTSVGIERRLPWLRDYFDRSFVGPRFSNPHGPLVENVRAGSFSTELHR
jgi:hypothetical protein